MAQQPAVPSSPEQHKSQKLIADVERVFTSGEGHYSKGELGKAKADFDKAVDMMLASGLDIKADPQLDDEFNRILDAVNALEMEALKQGNGFTPAPELTPAEAANEVTFVVDPNVVAKAKAELATTKSDLPLVINDYVAAYINSFANTQRGHNTLKHSLERSGKYKDMIERVLKEEGVPQDLIYLAVAESAFQPQVVNRGSGAGGMWQFMPHDPYYGLAANGYVDERFDPEKSTRAYAKYMKFLYDQLGDWYLAMAAYNWGAGMVQRAVQKTGYADFWELYKRNNLPAQTKNYVPEILAAIIISRNLKQYGFDDITLDPPVVFDTVPIDYSVDIRLVADVTDVEPQQIMELNPSLLRLTTPPSDLLNGPFQLHLPPGTATLFQQRIADIPADRRNQWRYHRVTPDDTLASVARSYHVSVASLAEVNDLSASDTISDVDALVVPVAPVVSAPRRAETYRARRGDTLVTIADRFGVSLESLRHWNHLIGNSVKAGARIRVSEPSHAAPRTSENGSNKRAKDEKQTPSSEHKSQSSKHGSHAQAAGDPPAKTKPSSKSHSAHTSSSSKSASAKASDKAHHEKASHKKLQK
ncbi:transglycosylase SLT domain-containing protein [Acidicapsa dinghuensis]|uniref:Transglycosylase SLT domain-containing protein n=1 Tax=Acidicapsa dinghuensis TaxID=2218256 RepID=A0ABW1EE20_9BACT|nr:transglycosylase SLT domain-containing protein [Acidicapsa dinghuensis]